MSKKVRLLLEILVIAGLAFGIWHFRDLFFGSGKGPVDTAQVEPDKESVKVLRGSKSKEDTPRRDRDEPQETARAPVSATPSSVKPEPTAPQTGTLLVSVVDSQGLPSDASGTLIGSECGINLPIVQGRIAGEILPLSCEVYGRFTVDGRSVETRPVALQVTAGQPTSIILTLPPPAQAHPGVILAKSGEFAEVVNVQAGSSAEANRLKAGDVVFQMGEYLIADLSEEDIATLLLGPPGSPLSLTIIVQQGDQIAEGRVQLTRDTLVE